MPRRNGRKRHTEPDLQGDLIIPFPAVAYFERGPDGKPQGYGIVPVVTIRNVYSGSPPSLRPLSLSEIDAAVMEGIEKALMAGRRSRPEHRASARGIAQDAEIAKEREAGATPGWLANKYGVSERTIQRACQRHKKRHN